MAHSRWSFGEGQASVVHGVGRWKRHGRFLGLYTWWGDGILCFLRLGQMQVMPAVRREAHLPCNCLPLALTSTRPKPWGSTTLTLTLRGEVIRCGRARILRPCLPGRCVYPCSDYSIQSILSRGFSVFESIPDARLPNVVTPALAMSAGIPPCRYLWCWSWIPYDCPGDAGGHPHEDQAGTKQDCASCT